MDPAHDHDRPLQRNDSTSSLDSVLPPPLKHKKRVQFLLVVLIACTLAMLVVCCIYADIAGHAQYYYSKPESWQFCVIYTDSTVQLWDKKVVDGVAPIFSYIGLMNLIYTWAGLAATFRAMFHFEWIPSTMAFMFFNLFGQLCYYQSNNLVVAVPKLPTSLIAATNFVRLDMYDNLGKWCTFSYYQFGNILPNLPKGELFPRPVPNCTDAVVIIGPDVQAAPDQITQINLLTNSTVPNSDLNCDGAVGLHVTFLTLCYVLAAITLALIVVLWLADREIRRNRPKRHFFKETKEDLKGDKYCLWLCFMAAAGYIMTSIANCNAALVGQSLVHDYHLIDSNTELTMPSNFGPVIIDIDLNFYVNAYLPFKNNQLNLQTVLLIITCMSVIRGHFKQSISAFRLAAVTSLLAVIIQWPPVVGNLETVNWADLWWWDDADKCADFHSGLPYLDPDHKKSQRYCSDTRWGVAGALVTFVALHLNMVLCARVYAQNSSRESLIVDTDGPLGMQAAPGLGDPFSFDYNQDGQAYTHSNAQAGKPPSERGSAAAVRTPI